MAIIPRPPENVRMQVSNPVPIASTTGVRRQGEALSNVGDAVAGFAQKQIQFDQSLRYDEGVNKLKNLRAEGIAYADRTAKEDGSDYNERYLEYTQDKEANVLNTYGTDPRTNRRLNSAAQMVRDDANTQLLIKSAVKREQYNYSRDMNLNDDSANRIREGATGTDSDIDLITSEIVTRAASVQEKVGSGVYSQETGNKMLEDFRKKAAVQYIEGLGNKELYAKALNFLQANVENQDLVAEIAPEDAQKIGLVTSDEANSLASQGQMYKMPVYTKGDKVKLTPAMATLANSLDPQEKSRLIDALNAKVKESTQMRIADLNAELSGFIDIAQSGGKYTQAQMDNLLQSIANNPQLSLPAKRRAVDAVVSADAINKVVRIAANTPRSEWGKLIGNAKSKIENSGAKLEAMDEKFKGMGQDFAIRQNREEMVTKLEASLKSMQAQQDKDGAAFALQNNTALQTLYRASRDAGATPEGTQAFGKYLDNLVNQQKYYGMSPDKIRVSTLSEAANVADTIKAMPEAASLNEYLAGLEVTYGKHFPKLMDEVAKADKDLSGYKPIAHIAPETRGKLLDALKNKEAITSQFNKDFPDQKNDITTEVNKSLRELKNTVLKQAEGSEGTSYLDAIQEQIELRVKRDMVKEGGRVGAAQLTQKAYNEIVDSNFYIAKGGNSEIPVPRNQKDFQIGEQGKIFNSFLSVYSRAENFKNLNVAVPESYKNMNQEQIRARMFQVNQGLYNKVPQPATGEEMFYAELQNSHAWVANNDLTGVELMVKAPQGGMVNVFDKTGRPITRSYRDIYYTTDRKVLDHNAGFLGRLFGN